jgi:hypothetical protein
MRIQKHSLVVVITLVSFFAGLWFVLARKQKFLAAEDQVLNRTNSSRDFDSALAKYQSMGDDYRAKCLFAAELAAVQADLWVSCATRILGADTEDRLAIAHFASSYFRRGQKEKDELIALLHSDDENLVRGVLVLLSYTVELGKNDEWQLDKPLGGGSIPPHISAAYRLHPELPNSVATAMGRYGSLAKPEVVTLLIMMLSSDPLASFAGKVALWEVDPEGLFRRFGLALDKPLTDEQKTRIEEFIKGRQV